MYGNGGRTKILQALGIRHAQTHHHGGADIGTIEGHALPVGERRAVETSDFPIGDRAITYIETTGVYLGHGHESLIVVETHSEAIAKGSGWRIIHLAEGHRALVRITGRVAHYKG